MTSTRLITLLLVFWHGSQCCVTGTKVKGVRRNTNKDSEGASGSGNEAAMARHQVLRKFYQHKRLLQANADSRDDAGFLSSGLFGTFNDFRGPNEDGSWTLPGGSSDNTEEATAVTATSPPIIQAKGNSNGGALASYGSYYGGLGHAFQGGFPITCRPREEGRMKGIVKKGKKGQKNGKKSKKGAKSGGEGSVGKGKGDKYKSYSKGSKGSSRSGKGKGSKRSSRSGKGSGKGSKGSKGSSRSGKGKGGGYYGGFLSRARYFNGVSNGSIHAPRERPNRRQSGYVSVRRSDILDMECYFGAFPPFSGIPDTFPAKPPSVAPSQGPPTIFPTQAPSIAVNQTSEPTSGLTTPPTISPTVTPTLSPTIAPSLPLATIAPTIITSAPTVSTAQPTAATLAPTAATLAPTAATLVPTVSTSAPSVATVSPTAGTASPSESTSAPTLAGAEATNVTLLSLLNYGYFEDAEIDRAPTQEEIDGLVEQTVLFYSELFTTAYGDDFVQFRFILNESSNDFARDLPFQMDFDALVTFGPNIEMEQTPRDVFNVMEADQPLYQRYITEFVWNSAPAGTQFGETMEVMFEAKAGQFA